MKRHEMTLISTEQASSETGVTDTTLQYWARTGLIDPAVYRQGRGTSTMWDKKNLHELQTIKELRALLPMQTLRKVSRLLKSLGHNPFSRGEFSFADVHGTRLIKTMDGYSIELTGAAPGQLLIIPCQLIGRTGR